MRRCLKYLAAWVLICACAQASAEELSFLQANPELKATLLQWEREAPQEVKAETKVLRTADAVGKVYAAMRLGKMGDKAKGAALALIETFKDTTVLGQGPDEGCSPAEEAMDALARMPAAFDALVAALKDKDPDVRETAAETLGLVRDIRAVEPLLAALRYVGSGFDAPGVGASEAAARALDEIEPKWRKGGPATRAIPELIAALGDRETEARAGAAFALGQIRDPRAAGPLIQTLSDGDAFVRACAAWALGQIKDVRAVEPLIGALRDHNKWVRGLAAQALESMDSKWARSDAAKRAVPGFVTALRDNDEAMRVFAALLLGNLKDERAVEPLIAVLNSPDAELREAAAGALGDIGNARAVESLTAALKDPQRSVRRAAARALGQIKDARVVEPLIAALKDADSGVRSNAARGLAEAKDPRAVEPLVAALRDRDELVRMIVAEALGKIGDRRAVEPLVVALKDESEVVRRRAAKALRTITGERFEANYEAWKRWWDAQKESPAGGENK